MPGAAWTSSYARGRRSRKDIGHEKLKPAKRHITSPSLINHAGFSPDPLYPEYSTDFFDGEHYVLKGSSPYTHPSMRRTSFRNFYQHLYPYVPAKFRLVFDAREE